MGKNYWCEFCERGFSDILSIRKKHINSIQHQRSRKLHYDSFKDAATILQEESQKNACKRFFQTGRCDFGDQCRFSHKDLSALKHQVQRNNRREIDLNAVHEWIEKWKKNKKTITKEDMKYRLPPAFPPPYQLPPSLQPPMDGLELEDMQWG